MNLRRFLTFAPLVIALFLLGLIFALLQHRFLTPENIGNILEQNTIYALLAFGMTFVILTGGIDLSVGSTLAFAAMTAIFVSQWTDSFLLTFVAGLGAGAFIGAVNGALIAFARLPPFIATLATMSAARGLAYLYTGKELGVPLEVPDRHMFFRHIADPDLEIWYLLFFFVLCLYLLHGTRFGHYVYAIGGNREAARFTGIPIRRTEFFVYVLSGLFAGMAGILMASELLAVKPDVGQMYELNAIAAVVVGGTSFSGGVGSVAGTGIGVVILGVVENGFNLVNLHFSYRYIVRGAVIVLAVFLDVLSRRGEK